MKKTHLTKTADLPTPCKLCIGRKPNKTTKRSLKNITKRKGLKRFSSIQELFEELSK